MRHGSFIQTGAGPNQNHPEEGPGFSSAFANTV